MVVFNAIVVKIVALHILLLYYSVAVVSSFSTEIISNTAVRAMWSEVESPYLDHYTVYYYYPNSAQNGSGTERVNEKMVEFPAGSSFGVIGALDEKLEYLFALTVTFNINGTMIEGKRTPLSGYAWASTNVDKTVLAKLSCE